MHHLIIINCCLPSAKTVSALNTYKDDKGSVMELIENHQGSAKIIITGDFNADIYKRIGDDEKQVKNLEMKH